MQTITQQTASLPMVVNLMLSVQQQACYAGDYPPAIVVRLAAATMGVTSKIHATLNFSLDAHRLIVISGSASVEVALICHRCSERFTHMLSADYCVSPVMSDDMAKKLPIAYDPILLDQSDRLDLVTLIEDELLLNLPLLPAHPRDECQTEIWDAMDNSEPDVVAGGHAVHLRC